MSYTHTVPTKVRHKESILIFNHFYFKNAVRIFFVIEPLWSDERAADHNGNPSSPRDIDKCVKRTFKTNNNSNDEKIN